MIVITHAELSLNAGGVASTRPRDDIHPQISSRLLDLPLGERPFGTEGSIKGIGVSGQPWVEMACLAGPEIFGGPSLQLADFGHLASNIDASTVHCAVAAPLTSPRSDLRPSSRANQSSPCTITSLAPWT